MGMLLLSVFLSFFVNNTFFTHYHLINGVTVVHSHFHKQEKKGEPVSHQHSSKELIFIQYSSNPLFTFAASIYFVDVVARSVSIQKFQLRDFFQIKQNLVSHNGLRGPPFIT